MTFASRLALELNGVAGEQNLKSWALCRYRSDRVRPSEVEADFKKGAIGCAQMTLESLAIGTMNFGRRTPEAEARRIIEVAIERGASLFDTANMYGDGESERILGRVLKARRREVRIATKVGAWRKEGLSKPRILAAIDESLERLKTDFVDVYYLHAPDHQTPVSETLEAISTLLTSGKIRSWGISNYAAWQWVEINGLCQSHAMSKPAYSQVLYNLLVRQVEVEYLPCVKQFSIHTTVYNPLAGGLLARPVTSSIPPGSRFEFNPVYRKRYWSHRMHELTAALQMVADEASLSLVTLAYAWLLKRPGVNSVLAGPGSVAHLEAALDAVQVTLPDEVITSVDEVYRQFTGSDASYAR